MRSITALLLLGGFVCGCARREPLDHSCRMASETPSARRALADDARRAEDRAIRYADSVKAPHSGHFEGFAAYQQATDSCETVLFGEVARRHAVSVGEVRAAVERRSFVADAAVMLTFAALYGLVAYATTRSLPDTYPLDGGSGSAVAVVSTVVSSALASGVAVLVGEWYSIVVEMIRVGNGHLSDRTGRIPWTHHRGALFAAGVVLFWLIAAYRYRTAARLLDVTGRRPAPRPPRS